MEQATGYRIRNLPVVTKYVATVKAVVITACGSPSWLRNIAIQINANINDAAGGATIMSANFERSNFLKNSIP
jgi:hypothetical protein